MQFHFNMVSIDTVWEYPRAESFETSLVYAMPLFKVGLSKEDSGVTT